jgi:chromosome partitioning protein
MIIGVVNQKGGAGKTTLTVNIAGALAHRGHTTCIVDTDPQGSVLQWQALEDASLVSVKHKPAVLAKKDVQSLRRRHQFILIDSPPALERITLGVLKLVDLVIVPITPSPLDIWSANETIRLIKSVKRQSKKMNPHLLVYRKVPGTRIGRQARDALKNYNLPVFKTEITHRIAYVEAMNTGLPVTVFAPRSKAAKEINALIEEFI